MLRKSRQREDSKLKHAMLKREFFPLASALTSFCFDKFGRTEKQSKCSVFGPSNLGIGNWRWETRFWSAMGGQVAIFPAAAFARFRFLVSSLRVADYELLTTDR